ncbi:hypothetical protein CEXT_196721 [Caerostris extrusa]|uniref:Uncharacterized protein n=1 Tax=Caerostris extrusa TaxID=172846 RepID=A0AAV4MSQ0_CAEEX|nr:hypothetical protein CEXT_196721 [Caerostris extrusa]
MHQRKSLDNVSFRHSSKLVVVSFLEFSNNPHVFHFPLAVLMRHKRELVAQCPQSPNQTLLRRSSPSVKGEIEPQASFNLTNQKFHEQSSVLDREKEYVTCVLSS